MPYYYGKTRFNAKEPITASLHKSKLWKEKSFVNQQWPAIIMTNVSVRNQMKTTTLEENGLIIIKRLTGRKRFS